MRNTVLVAVAVMLVSTLAWAQQRPTRVDPNQPVGYKLDNGRAVSFLPEMVEGRIDPVNGSAGVIYVRGMGRLPVPNNVWAKLIKRIEAVRPVDYILAEPEMIEPEQPEQKP